MNRQSKNAQRIAEALAPHPRIARLIYPTLFKDREQVRIRDQQCRDELRGVEGVPQAAGVGHGLDGQGRRLLDRPLRDGSGPTTTLFIRLKLSRLSEQDFADCAAVIRATARGDLFAVRVDANAVRALVERCSEKW